MLEKEKIERINTLAKKAKAEGLSLSEQNEQKALRDEYIQVFRKGMRHHIEGMKVVDPEGTDVTPDKLKKIQAEKKLHNRHVEPNE